MAHIDCIASQGDYITIEKTKDMYGKPISEIKVCEEGSISVILINQYSAEQIIDALKKQFDL